MVYNYEGTCIVKLELYKIVIKDLSNSSGRFVFTITVYYNS